MRKKCLAIVVFLALFQTVSSRPKDKLTSLETKQVDPDTKIREKRKYEVPIMRHLEESGLGIRRSLGKDEDTIGSKVVITDLEKETIPTTESTEKIEKSDVEEGEASKGRVKKQSPNNVCIKVGGCGKTVCGPIVSARGSIANDMRTLMQATKPIMSLGSTALGEMSDMASKVEQLNPMQARTFDTLMGLSPLSLGSMGSLGYGSPAVYSAAPVSTGLSTDSSSLNYGHSFFKPPTLPTIPIAIVTQHPSHSLIHPWLLPHLLPHVMGHLPSTTGTYVTPHRIEPQRLPESTQNDVKQPVPVPVPVPAPIPAFPPPTYFSSDSTLLCQPFRNTKLDNSYDYIYKPDLPIDKSLNVSDASKKSQDGYSQDEERRIHEHLKKVNEIKEEISQLNRAAQRIVDQQERLTEMQQKQLWGNSMSSASSSAMSSMQGGSNQMSHLSHPYMGAGYYSHPLNSWRYSRPSILSYPDSQDDIEFFVNLLRTGKKIGLISDSFQPTLTTVGDGGKYSTISPAVQKGTVNAVGGVSAEVDKNKGSVQGDKKPVA